MKSDTMTLSGPAKYFFLRALRPFSLSVALVACGLGITLAWVHGQGDTLRAVLVLVAGVLLQAAVNLFNDYADLPVWAARDDLYGQNVVAMIRRNVLVAKIMTGAAVIMGLVLVFQAGWPLLFIGLAGLIGGYFYTAEPVSYKNRGFGVLGVFLFTGILMVTGSYLAVSGQWSQQVVLFSVPVSLISSMLLLANELRDFNEDSGNNIGTLTVRWGFERAGLLYRLLGVGALIFVWGLGLSGVLTSPWFTLIPVLVLKAPYRLLGTVRSDDRRKQLVRLPPLTGRFFLLFGICMMLAV